MTVGATRKKLVTVAIALLAIAFLMPLAAKEAMATRIWKKIDTTNFQLETSDPQDVLARKINLRKRGNVAIIYSAECAVFSDFAGHRVVINILVDDILQTVTASKNFCSTNADGSATGFGSHASNVVVNLLPGEHNITIRAVPVGNIPTTGVAFWISDQSLTIIAEKN